MAIWLPKKPELIDRWNEVPGFLHNNFEAYGAATSAEHGNLGHATASGTHVLCGNAGVCFYGTTSEINAISSPPCGALAYDSTLGWMKHYWPDTWYQTTLSADGWSRARWYLDTAIATTDSVTVGLSFDGKTYDSASEWDSSAGNFTASAAGTYLIICQATMYASGSIGDYPRNTLQAWKNYFGATCASIAVATYYSLSTEAQQNDSIRFITATQLAKGDKVSFWITRTVADDKVMDGSSNTYFAIHRMGNSCL